MCHPRATSRRAPPGIYPGKVRAGNGSRRPPWIYTGGESRRRGYSRPGFPFVRLLLDTVSGYIPALLNHSKVNPKNQPFFGIYRKNSNMHKKYKCVYAYCTMQYLRGYLIIFCVSSENTCHAVKRENLPFSGVFRFRRTFPAGLF